MMMMSATTILTSIIYGFVAIYLGLGMIAAAAVAVIQEGKIWESQSIPSLSIWARLKVFWFNIVWMACCFVGSFLIVCKWILTFGTYSRLAWEANRWVEQWTARICISVFIGRISVDGEQYLPSTPDNSSNKQIPAPIYVANHASQIDVGAVYYVMQQPQQFKWIAKKSVLYLPGVGQVMYLGEHVLIDRKKGRNGKSVTNLFDKSNASVQAGIPMFFFPQGTRRLAERLPAKDGAFIVAQTNQSPLIPISIDIPLDAWNSLYPFNLLWGGKAPVVKLTVHKPIPVTGKEDRQELKQRCMQQIYSVLPEYDEAYKDK